MRHFLLVILIFCNVCFAKEMNTATSHYKFATKAMDNLDSSVADCDSYALQDPEIEWVCGSYTQDHQSFMDSWEALMQSLDYQLIQHSDWSVFYDVNNSVDFYGKTYYLDETEMLVAFDPSETGREIFIGASPQVFSLIAGADKYVKTTSNTSTPLITSSQFDLSGSYDCKNFKSQSEAVQFFTSNGFNSEYDPYNLDADNNGIPCEVFQDEINYSSQCSANKYWVNSYTRKNGTKVKGHCRKRS